MADAVPPYPPEKPAKSEATSCEVSIIICTRGRGRELGNTLASLARVEVPLTWHAEVLVVENGSKDEAEAVTASFAHNRISARYLFEPVGGKSRALNLALAEARGEILLFTDDDIRFPANWIIEMCTPLHRGEGSVAVGGCRLAPHLLRDWMTKYHRGFLGSTEYLSDTDPSEFAGANWACLRSALSQVPRFDCDLGGGGVGNGEDSLFARQLKAAGCFFISRTKVWVEHHPLESRLSYQGWLQAASSCGRGEAYRLHHWYHQNIPFAHIRLLYFLLKLHLRLFVHRRRSLEAEGIPAWELSYRIDIARLRHFIPESRRPRKYPRLGLAKLGAIIDQRS